MRELNARTDIGGSRWSTARLRDLLTVQTTRLLGHPAWRALKHTTHPSSAISFRLRKFNVRDATENTVHETRVNRALGGVDDWGPAVRGVLGQVGGGQHDPAAAGQILHDQTVVRSGAQGLVAVAAADVAVSHEQLAVVAAGPEDVSGLPLPAPGDRDLTRPVI